MPSVITVCTAPAAQTISCPIDPLALITVVDTCYAGVGCFSGSFGLGSTSLTCAGSVWDGNIGDVVDVQGVCTLTSFFPDAPSITNADVVAASWGVVACWVVAWGIRHLLGRAAET